MRKYSIVISERGFQNGFFVASGFNRLEFQLLIDLYLSLFFFDSHLLGTLCPTKVVPFRNVLVVTSYKKLNSKFFLIFK